MNAKDITGKAPGGKRIRLAEALPLDTPLVVQFFPIYACNFTCRYCTFSIPADARGFISDNVVMDHGLFQKCIDDLAAFPSRVKTLRFVGMGEPLLHRQIADMVAYASQMKVAERVEILSNGSLLTPELSDALIAAGLSRLVISLQGTTAEKYRQISDVDLDFSAFLQNLRYFYAHKGSVQMHLKIIDLALDGSEDTARFFDTFSGICDTIGIEHAGPIYPGVRCNDELNHNSARLTQFGLPVTENDVLSICPQAFFTMQINPDGNVVPCYSIAYPLVIGNCATESLLDIWRGAPLRDFRVRMLESAQNACEACAACKISRHRKFEEDSLDADVGRLKKIYEAM